MTPPPAVETLLHDGVTHHQAGRLSQAERCYETVLALDPGHADGLHLLGLVAHHRGDTESAIERIGQAVTVRPEVALFHRNLGASCVAAGLWPRAESAFRKALLLQPGDAGTHHQLALVLLRTGRARQAEASLRIALGLAPELAELHADLGAALHRLGRLTEAEAALRRALQLDPDAVAPLASLGLVLAGQDRAAEAEACHRRVIALRPAEAAGWNNLGALLHDRGRFAEAETALLEAVRVAPGHADAQANLGAVRIAQARLAEAEAPLQIALRLVPDHADAQYALATSRLLAGRLAAAWPGFEQRHRRRGAPPARRFAQPQWQGEKLDGRTLLLHAEQGLGDTIQMARFVPALARRSRVLLEIPGSLLRLFTTLDGPATLLPRGAEPPQFDLHCPLMSLPHALGLTPETIPAGAYLGADPAAWRQRLAGLPGRRVGLAWAGNPDYPADHRRSIPPSLLRALDGLAGISFVSLQKSAVAPGGFALHDWTDQLHDLADTAALIAGLDLVVSVDTAVAHLAAALGRPVWLLNRFDTDWRWQLDRADSAWYPGLRQFRQPSPGDWPAVLAALRRALNESA